jgi:hypothetical protein
MIVMSSKLVSLTATAAVAAAAFAPAAGATDQSTSTPIKVQGAYAYIDHLYPHNTPYLRVVFRTSAPLPRRFDGLIRAAGAIDGQPHSISTVRKPQSIYTVISPIRDGKITTIHGSQVAKRTAKVGRTYTFTLTVQGGQRVNEKVTLRAERKGDDSGRALVR